MSDTVTTGEIQEASIPLSVDESDIKSLPFASTEEQNICDLIPFCRKYSVREFAVIEHAGKRLFCDGHILVAVADMDVRNGYETENRQAAIADNAPKMWDKWATNPDPLKALKKVELRGSFWSGYSRWFETEDGTVVRVNERYVRCFPEDAEWFGATNNTSESAVIVRRGGELLGVVMPMMPLDARSSLARVPWLENDVLYFHQGDCPWMDMDD